ncbi:OmpA family protein [Longimicrobium sp.]|uniref:OmpA family protein n=1 Tax=Longimicrobium sp. TaxID=2029185 RepID=UPI002D18E375|nr:OmpA family protein [Longimicrobium sp.]HSU17214.1 OmpA family protein [Longimicrobium sp.]
MRLRSPLAAAVLTALAASALAAQDNPHAFGTAGNTPFALKGQIYYLDEGTDHLPDFSRLRPVGTISTTTLNVPDQSFEVGFPGVTDRFEWFAIDYRGAVVAPEAGTYRFRLTSDDGSRLIIDGRQVIDNDGVHGPGAVEDSVQLAEGVHSIEVQYFQGPRVQVALVLEIAQGGEDYQPMDFARYGAATFRDEGNRLVAQLGGNVLFDTNSSVLKPQALAALEELRTSMIAPYPDAKVTVEGHTDNVGGDADNQRLSEARAQSVVQWLVQHGVPAARLEAHGYGKTRPAFPNDTPANRAKNRRIEIIVQKQ